MWPIILPNFDWLLKYVEDKLNVSQDSETHLHLTYSTVRGKSCKNNVIDREKHCNLYCQVNLQNNIYLVAVHMTVHMSLSLKCMQPSAKFAFHTGRLCYI